MRISDWSSDVCSSDLLEAFNPVAGRMQPRKLAGGFQLIDDTYNANHDSVRAAIDVLAPLAGKKILVLGDMGRSDERRAGKAGGSTCRSRGLPARYKKIHTRP